MTSVKATLLVAMTTPNPTWIEGLEGQQKGSDSQVLLARKTEIARCTKLHKIKYWVKNSTRENLKRVNKMGRLRDP